MAPLAPFTQDSLHREVLKFRVLGNLGSLEIMGWGMYKIMHRVGEGDLADESTD